MDSDATTIDCVIRVSACIYLIYELISNMGRIERIVFGRFSPAPPEDLKYFRDRVRSYKDGHIAKCDLPGVHKVPFGISNTEVEELEMLVDEDLDKRERKAKNRKKFYEDFDRRQNTDLQTGG